MGGWACLRAVLRRGEVDRVLPLDQRVAANCLRRRAVLARIGAQAQVLFGAEMGEGAASVGHMRDAQAHDVLGGAPLVPVKDPRLSESLSYEDV